MKFSQAGKMAISAVLSNKLRSFLTMLGIIIGVMAVTLLISLVQGASNTVTGRLDELGGNQLIVQIVDRQKRMTLHELLELEGKKGIETVSPSMSGRGSAVAGSNEYDVSIVGVTDRYDDIQGLDLDFGRCVNQNDVDYRLDVAVIGYSVAQELFGMSDVLDHTVRISGTDYRIIGVAEQTEDTLMGSVNDSVFIPITNAQRLLKQVSINTFYAAAENESRLNEAQSALKDFLMEKYGDEDDFQIVNMKTVIEIVGDVMSALELLLAAIAGISLVVGGIGIMNIMLVSVTERTREIGIRKAIGAQKSDIVVQFLIESVILSLAGGIVGMLLSQGVLSAINYFAPNYHFFITTQVGCVALGFSIFVGIVFGIYPANKAAQLKPINALRYE